MGSQNDLSGIEDMLCGQLGNLVDEVLRTGNYQHFEAAFANALHQNYLAVMMSVMDYSVTDAGFHKVDAFLAEQKKYLFMIILQYQVAFTLLF